MEARKRLRLEYDKVVKLPASDWYRTEGENYA